MYPIISKLHTRFAMNMAKPNSLKEQNLDKCSQNKTNLKYDIKVKKMKEELEKDNLR